MAKQKDLNPALEHAIADRDRLRDELTRVDNVVRYLEAQMDGSGKAKRMTSLQSFRFVDKSAAEAAAIVLKEHRGPMHINQIIQKILDGGYTAQTNRKKLYANLFARLTRKARKGHTFKKGKEPGVFMLA